MIVIKIYIYKLIDSAAKIYKYDINAKKRSCYFKSSRRILFVFNTKVINLRIER